MPLDPVAHLTAQGWKGKGTGFKQDSLSRPIAVRMKTSLTGVGKDRDEAFPFWDHVFSAAAKSIIIPDPSSDGDSSSDDEANPSSKPFSSSVPTSSVPHQFQRTTTGIISPFAPSTARSSAYTSPAPTPSTDADNGLPSSIDGLASSLNMSIMASAKREAAKKGLYDRFNRGGWIKPHWDEYEPPKVEEKKGKGKEEVEKVKVKKEKRDKLPGVIVQDVMASTASASSLPSSPKKEKKSKKSKSSVPGVVDPHHVPPPSDIVSKASKSKSKSSKSKSTSSPSSPKSSNMTGLITDPLSTLPSSSSSSSLPASFDAIPSSPPLASSTPLAEKKESKEDRRRRKEAEIVAKEQKKEVKRLEKEARKMAEESGGKREKKRKRDRADEGGEAAGSREGDGESAAVKESKEDRRARRGKEKLVKEGLKREKEEKKARKASSKKAKGNIDA